jgi:catechol 2,3-dioxygenase-like lactoylglutathione lyase family enzyme
MLLPKTHIHLGVDDSNRSTAFYEALLGAPPSSRHANAIVFDFDEPAILLVLEPRVTVETAGPRPNRRGRRTHRRREAPLAAEARYALVVPDPEHVGKAAVALWRVGAPLRLQDQGIETLDPDGNGWKVRFVPFARGSAVIAVSPEAGHARN